MSTDSAIRRRLAELGMRWPEPPPRHEYLPATQVGDLVFVSGHAPYLDGSHRYVGRVGDELDLASAREAARLAVLGCLVSLEQVVQTLDAVQRIVKVNGYVHCVPGFPALPRITDGASELLIELFGPSGRHARTTVGVASLPSGVAVELEVTALVRST